MTLRENFLKHWQAFKEGKPGKRFEERYWQRKKESQGHVPWSKLLYTVLGSLCIIVGVIMFAIPGPGLLVVAFGLAMLSSEFLFCARWLDWAEPKARTLLAGLRKRWRRLSFMAKAAVLLASGACTLAASYGVYCLLR